MTEPITQKLFYVATIGCQMNEYDSDRMVRMMSAEGYVQTPDMDRADLIMLNTCTIREKAEQKVMSFLGRLRPLKKKNPELIIGVGGCVAQQLGEVLLKKLPHLDLVLGTQNVHRLPELAAEVRRTGRPVCVTRFDYALVPPPPLKTGRAPLKAFLTIMQGCDNFCAYCVVPYVRGREISRAPEDILAEARDLVAHGVKEITLLGQNVNSYGRGLSPQITFTDLIEQVALLPGLARIRFTTSHPKDLSPELIRAIAEVGPLCEHIHLPVQSGSDRILKAMRRVYTRDDYLAKVAALRAACPEAFITTDVIVGFPGETEADFEQTMDLVNRIQYDGMFSFKYSDRPMTKASKLKNKVDESVKERRLDDLQTFQKRITLSRNRSRIGRRLEVLVEGRNRRDARQLTGRSRGNQVVNFVGPDELIGEPTMVRITGAGPNSLRGEPDEAPKGD